MAGIESLLESTSLTTPIDVPTLLSSEYDSDGASALETSYEQSGDFSSLAPTPVGPTRTKSALPGAAEITELERERRREQRRDQETIQQLRNENAQLKQAAAAAEARNADDFKAYHDAVEAAARRSRGELHELSVKLTEMSAEMPVLRGRLSAGKTEFAQLVIDGARYQQLRQCADEEVSVVEHVQMRVYDLMRGAERNAEKVADARQLSEGLVDKLKAERDAREALTMKLAEVGARAEAKSRETEEYQLEVKRLRAELAAAATTPEGKALASLEIAEQRLQAKGEEAIEAAKQLVEARHVAAKMTKDAEEHESKAKYLAQDKEFLTLQLRAVEERVAAAEQRASREEAAAAEAQSELGKAKEALMRTAKENAEEYKLRLEGEMLRWESANKSIRDAHQEAHKDAISIHRDTREIAVADATKWQDMYNHLKREHDEVSLAAAEAAGRAEASMAEMRSEARLKSFEAERMRMQCEQALVQSRQAIADAQAKGEKLEVLKSEYHALRTDSLTKIATLEAASASLTERVKTYEALEEELDRTVLQAGAIAAAGGEGGGSGGGDAGAIGGLRVPSSAQRRMQQCLTLAKDLLATQRRAEVAEAAVIEAQGEVKRLQGVSDEVNRRLRQSGQPQNYLAEQVEVLEGAKLEAEARVGALVQQLSEHADALAAARGQNAQLLKDLESLLSQRGSLDALRATLTRLLPQEMMPPLVPAA